MKHTDNIIYLDEYRKKLNTPSPLSFNSEIIMQSEKNQLFSLFEGFNVGICDLEKTRNAFYQKLKSKTFLLPLKFQFLFEMLSLHTPFIQAFEDDYFEDNIVSYRVENLNQKSLEDYYIFLGDLQTKIFNLGILKGEEISNLIYCGYEIKTKKIAGKELLQIYNFFNPSHFLQFEKKEKDLELKSICIYILMLKKELSKILEKDFKILNFS